MGFGKLKPNASVETALKKKLLGSLLCDRPNRNIQSKDHKLEMGTKHVFLNCQPVTR